MKKYLLLLLGVIFILIISFCNKIIKQAQTSESCNNSIAESSVKRQVAKNYIFLDYLQNKFSPYIIYSLSKAKCLYYWSSFSSSQPNINIKAYDSAYEYGYHKFVEDYNGTLTFASVFTNRVNNKTGTSLCRATLYIGKYNVGNVNYTIQKSVLNGIKVQVTNFDDKFKKHQHELY